MNNKALILVDLQNDFFPGGTLGIPSALELFPLANDLQEYFEVIIASKDWHPNDHKCFASNHPNHKVYDLINLKGTQQILWPNHCIKYSKGSEFHPKLKTNKITKVIYKGTDPDYDSYSIFFDNAHIRHTGLEDFLRSHHITDIYIMGLATDYCVLYSALDAAKLGFKTFIIQDGCRGINKNINDIETAFAKMKEASAYIINSEDVRKIS